MLVTLDIVLNKNIYCIYCIASIASNQTWKSQRHQCLRKEGVIVFHQDENLL